MKRMFLSLKLLQREFNFIPPGYAGDSPLLLLRWWVEVNLYFPKHDQNDRKL